MAHAAPQPTTVAREGFTNRVYKIICDAAGSNQLDWSEYDHDLLNLAREADALAGVSGPYGYLVMPIGLDEEHWRLCFSASDDAEEVSIPMFAKTDPFDALTARADVASQGEA